MYLGFWAGSVVKNSPTSAGDVSSIPGSGRSPGEGNGNPFQMPRQRSLGAIVHGVAKESDTTYWLSHHHHQHLIRYENESRSVMSDSCYSMDYTVHGILQARILEWVAIPFSRGSSQPRDRTHTSHIAGRFFTSWATREAPYQIYYLQISSPFSRQSFLYVDGFLTVQKLSSLI